MSIPKSELTFAAIVDAALDMAAAQGMESLTLGEVAKRLGISKSGVFSRVGSREALLHAVLQEYDRRFLGAVFAPAMVAAPAACRAWMPWSATGSNAPPMSKR